MDSTRDTHFFGHPRGLSTLFFTELWERFGYYGMRALLILFLTARVADGGLGFDDGKAGAIYGLYTAMVYMASLPGGWIADRFLGQRKAVFYGGILISAGYLMLASSNIAIFYAGMTVVVCGTGLLKPNVSTIVGQIYEPGDERRDSGFSIFYMGINIGAMVAPLVCGFVGERINWHLGFALSGFGMMIGVVQYWFGQRHLGDAGQHPVPFADAADAKQQYSLLRYATLGTIALAVVVIGADATGLIAITAEKLFNWVGAGLLLIVVGFFAWLYFGAHWTHQERNRLYVVGLLFLASALFWSAFEQAGSSLNLFAERGTNNFAFGYHFPTSWYQTLNSLYIITLAPVFSWFWIWLGHKQPSSPAKFAWGLIFVGLGFAILIPAAAMSEHGPKVTPIFLCVTYLLHTIGELCLSPVGLSAMTKLAPARVAGVMLGVWFLSTSVGNYIGGRTASFYSTFSVPVLFGAVTAYCLVAGLVMALIAKPAARLMGGVR